MRSSTICLVSAGQVARVMRASSGTHSDKPEVVGQIMSRRVRVATASRPLAELVSVMAEGGHHHIPILDDDRRLVGIVTQTDLVERVVMPCLVLQGPDDVAAGLRQ